MSRQTATACVVLLMLASPSCFAFYCNRLEAVAQEGAVQEELRTWVEENVVGKTVSESELALGDLFGPGFRWSGKTAPGERLGFGTDGHVRLIGPEPRDVLDDTVTQSIKSVLFTERSRTGILVRVPGSEDFGVDEKHLLRVSDDIAVLCFKVE